jgi:hypothetical protein
LINHNIFLQEFDYPANNVIEYIMIIVGIIGLFTSMMADLGLTPAFAFSHYQIGCNDGCTVEPLKKCNCNVMKVDSIFEENKSASGRKVNIEKWYFWS